MNCSHNCTALLDKQPRKATPNIFLVFLREITRYLFKSDYSISSLYYALLIVPGKIMILKAPILLDLMQNGGWLE